MIKLGNIQECEICDCMYCRDCAYANSCDDCLADTCGELSCIKECEIEKGCREYICSDCQNKHDCKKEEE